MMGLAAFDGPQLLILDEPTNHLDIDSRGELIEAINEYEGACILVSHDRRLLEACVDRLWLTANGTVKPFDGDLADYGRFVLGAEARPAEARKREPASNAPAAKPRREPAPLRRELSALEDRMNRFQDLLRRVDEALASASAGGGDQVKIADLAEKRAELERALTASEQAWFELSAEAGET
jgi:ATP-binding cassette subfamily F protein 3